MAKMSVKGIVYTSAFGPRTDVKVDPNDFHWGADYGPPIRNQTGVPLFAIFAGPVTKMKDQYGALGVRVGDRSTEAIEYWHLAAFDERLGKTAAEGQRVGEMGTTGRSTGIHVHVEHWVKGKRRDPVPFINKQAAKAVAEGDGDNDTDIQEGFLMALTQKQQERALALLEAIRDDQLYADRKFSRAQRTQELLQEIRDALLKPRTDTGGFPLLDFLRSHVQGIYNKVSR